MRRAPRRGLRPRFDSLDDRCLLSTLTPAQVLKAYGLDTLTFTSNGTTIKGDGTGQTIAIVDAYHDPYLLSDLQKFDRQYGLADPTLTVVNLAGKATDDGWAGEEALDVEWAHAIAPGAKILVVEARSDSVADLMAAVDVARKSAGVSVVSMSWGASEWSGQKAYDGYFTTPAGHTGVTFVAASGDESVYGGAEWPASSPNVVAVGGTTLNVASNGAYQSESLWTGSSGGLSQVYSEPSYQRTLQASGRRSTPDVSFVGDPNTGVAVYTTAPSTGKGAWYTYGGTSVGAPAWAAIVALADQGRTLNGSGTLDGPSQTLPLLYSLPAADFHKVASLNYVQRVGRYQIPVGTVTAGLGTPNGSALVSGLVGSGTTATASATTTTLTVVTRRRRPQSFGKAATIKAQATDPLVIDQVLADGLLDTPKAADEVRPRASTTRLFRSVSV